MVVAVLNKCFVHKTPKPQQKSFSQKIKKPMKSTLKYFSFLLVALFAVSCGGAQQDTAENTDSATNVAETPETANLVADGSYAIDAASSTIDWVGKKVTGQHNGKVKLGNGQFTVSGGNITGGSFSIDMTTITVEDIPADDEMNGKLLGHLKSDDFFSVEANPTATFEVTGVKPLTADANGNTHEISGNLSMKGISNPVTFPVAVSKDGDNINVKGNAVLDRTKWEIKFRSGKFFEDLGDKLINDEIELALNVKAAKANI